MRIAINNAIGLLEECLHNGDKGLVALQGWFLGERNLIEQTILDLSEIENQQNDTADGELTCIFERECSEAEIDCAEGCRYRR